MFDGNARVLSGFLVVVLCCFALTEGRAKLWFSVETDNGNIFTNPYAPAPQHQNTDAPFVIEHYGGFRFSSISTAGNVTANKTVTEWAVDWSVKPAMGFDSKYNTLFAIAIPYNGTVLVWDAITLEERYRFVPPSTVCNSTQQCITGGLRFTNPQRQTAGCPSGVGLSFITNSANCVLHLLDADTGAPCQAPVNLSFGVNPDAGPIHFVDSEPPLTVVVQPREGIITTFQTLTGAVQYTVPYRGDSFLFEFESFVANAPLRAPVFAYWLKMDPTTNSGNIAPYLVVRSLTDGTVNVQRQFSTLSPDTGSSTWIDTEIAFTAKDKLGNYDYRFDGISSRPLNGTFAVSAVVSPQQQTLFTVMASSGTAHHTLVGLPDDSNPSGNPVDLPMPFRSGGGGSIAAFQWFNSAPGVATLFDGYFSVFAVNF